MKLLLVGATGLVGSHVLRLALADPRVSSVVAPVRRLLVEHPKLSAPLVDFDRLPADAAWWTADAVICTLGTTAKKAGSQAAFRQVDHDYPLAVARIARTRFVRAYVLNSAIGADAGSRFFYNRVKGQVEDALKREEFESLTLVRPGVIGGHRNEFRFGERVLVLGLRLLAPLLPKRLRLNPAQAIAKKLLEAAINARPGVQIVTSDLMV